jgi:FkbM family methyltransferase
VKPQVLAGLKRLRASQPFNAVATTLVRAAMRLSGREWAWAVAHLHRVGPVAARLPNGRRLRLWSQADDWVSNQVFWKGWAGYEPETARVVFRLASRARLTVDVGAYVGFYTLLAALANPAGQVLALEPHPGACERLARNLERNGVRNATVVRAAAGALAGEAELHLAHDALPTSSSLSRAFMEPAGVRRSIPVQVVTLDQLLDDRPLDLLKLDTESTEPDVLAGARATLLRERPAIVCEVLPGRGTGAALEALLAPLGYRYHLLTPAGPQPRPRIAGDAAWLNQLFLPGAGPMSRVGEP